MYWLLRLFSILLLFVAPPASAGTVAMVLSDTGKPYGEFAAAFAEALAESPWQLITSRAGDASAPGEPAPELIVAVGVEALRQTLRRNLDVPVIATLLPRASYERAIAELRLPAGRLTAIWLDQPPSRQAAFIRHLLPGQKRVGMLLSSETRSIWPQFRRSFADAGLTLENEESDGDNALLPALNALLPRIGVFLAQPDSTLFRRDSIKAILVTTLRYQRPAIGYSAAFANAGGLAALYSTPAQIARQTAAAVIANGTSLPPPSGPALFALSINHSVAQSLGLDLPDESTIRQAMLGERYSR